MGSMFAEADTLRASSDDPESRPFDSKYAARELLRRALEQPKLREDEVARARYRLGAIAMAVEEPHEAQKELEAAVEIFFPGLTAALTAAAGDEIAEDAPPPPPAASAAGRAGLMRELPVLPPLAQKAHMLAAAEQSAMAVQWPEEAMDLLNHIGILSTQRGRPRRGTLYLQASVRAYNDVVLASSRGCNTAGHSNGTTALTKPAAVSGSAIVTGTTAVSGAAIVTGTTVVSDAATEAEPDSEPAAVTEVTTFSERAVVTEELEVADAATVTEDTAVAEAVTVTEAAAVSEAAAAAAEQQRLDALLTHAYFYLAQVHRRLDDAAGSARYCALTLQRQRQAAETAAAAASATAAAAGQADVAGSTGGASDGQEEFDVAEWAKNACHLADYHLGGNAFVKAATCLAAAADALEEGRLRQLAAGRRTGGGSGGGDSGGGSDDKATLAAANGGASANGYGADGVGAGPRRQELFAEREADVRRRLGRLYVMVMQVKHEELMLGKSEKSTLSDEAPGNESAEAASSCLSDDVIRARGSDGSSLQLPHINPAAVPCDFAGLREVFKRAMGHLQAAMAFFVLDGYVSDHVRLAQDVSRAYKYLSAFEEDEKRRLAMLGRRAAALSPLLDALGMQAYGELHLELSFELGEIYGDMADLKLSRIAAEEEAAALGGHKLTAGKLHRSNEPLQMAIRYFSHFVNMFEDCKMGGGGHSVDRAMLGPYLRAHFHVARSHGKLRYSELAPYLAAQTESLRGFQWLVDNAPSKIAEVSGGGSGNGSDAELFPEFGEELALARQMAELLPTKIARLNLQAAQAS